MFKNIYLIAISILLFSTACNYTPKEREEVEIDLDDLLNEVSEKKVEEPDKLEIDTTELEVLKEVEEE